MNRVILLLAVAIAVVLIGWLFVQTGQRSSQTPSEAVQGEVMQVPGGSYRNITSEELWAMLQNKDFVLINVHIPYEGELPQTDAFVPYNEVEKNLDKFPSDRAAKMVLYCMSGRMSAMAAETMVKLGYTNVWNLKEGMREWQQKGFPLLHKPQG